MNKKVKVSVGYGWQKFDTDGIAIGVNAVDSDCFWGTLKDTFDVKAIAINDSPCEVELGRLRSSHGCFVWKSIVDHIASSDVLIFDIANPPDFSDNEKLESLCEGDDITDLISRFNENVLVELGVAIGLGKETLMLCPESMFPHVPSDLKGFHWSLYRLEITEEGYRRKFVDPKGLSSAYQGMLRGAALKKASPQCQSC